jgi:outer membrane biosynthesis protein TonB
MSSEPRDGGAPRRVGLFVALGLSVLLHSLLILVGQWLPSGPFAALQSPRVAEPMVVVRFDVPPPQPEPERQPAPEPEREPEPPPPTPEQEPLLRPEPEPGVGPLTPTPGSSFAPKDGEDRDSAEERAREGSPSVVEPPPLPGGEARRRLDLGEALRDFEESLRDRPPAINGDPGDAPTDDGHRAVHPGIREGAFGMGNLVFESGDYDWTEYARQVLVILQRSLDQRMWRTLSSFERWAHENDTYVIRPDQAVYVRFVIERRGEVVGIAIEGSSGVTPLDAAARDSLEEALLPPLPANFPRDREVVHLVASFPRTAPIRGLRSHYNRMKALGLF